MFPVQPTSICHAGRQGFESPRSTYPTPPESRRKRPRFMPTAAQLLEYGLESGDRARARDTDCSICQERVSDPVVTPCQHIYCFECIHEWLRRSTKCPDCRNALRQTRSNSPSTFAAIIASTPTLAGRFSSSHWIARTGSPRAMKASRRRDPLSLDPFELAERLAALEQAAVVDEPIRRISNGSVSTATPPTIYKPARPWCLQRQMPLRNRAAYPVMCYGFLEVNQNDCGFADKPLLQTVERSAFTTPLSMKRSPIRAATMPLPVLNISRPLIDNEHDWDDRMVTINAENMLSRMWQTSNTLADSIDVPIRCRAIAKCVWREWRDFLQSSEGRLFCVDELLKGLLSKFKQAVIDYGWESDWQNLPRMFIDAMEKTTRAAVEKDISGVVRMNTL